VAPHSEERGLRSSFCSMERPPEAHLELPRQARLAFALPEVGAPLRRSGVAAALPRVLAAVGAVAVLVALLLEAPAVLALAVLPQREPSLEMNARIWGNAS
jgi:hypothetical protein